MLQLFVEEGDIQVQRGHLNGERFCGDYSTRTVHDLKNENRKCHIKKTIEAGDEIPFINLEIAMQSGYKRCQHCLNDDA